MNQRTLSRRTLLGCAALIASGCPGKSSGKIKIAASIFPLYDIARRVAGDKFDVVLVLPPGRSEHSYDPTPQEMARVASAKLAVAVGLEMDGWLERMIRNAAGGNVEIIQIGPRVNPQPIRHEHVGEDAIGENHHEQGHNHDDHDPEVGAPDPHVWMDPVRMQTVTDVMTDAFVRLAPAHTAEIRQRGTEVKRSLASLHDTLTNRSRAWTRRKIVTFHGSMAYLATRYNLEIVAVIEPFPGREPTPRYLADVLTAIRTTSPAALFSEPQLDRRPAQVVAEQARIPLFELDPVGGTAGKTSYESLLLRNADVLDQALR